MTMVLQNDRVRAEINPARGPGSCRCVWTRGSSHHHRCHEEPILRPVGQHASPRHLARRRDRPAGSPGTRAPGWRRSAPPARPRRRSRDTTLEIAGAPDGWCSLGFHPWFRRQLDVAGPVQADVEPITMVERNVDHLPTGALSTPTPRPWDHCFTLAALPRADLARRALPGIWLSDADWWVVFDASRDAVCLEPQTAPPDAIHHPALQPVTWSRSLPCGSASLRGR